MTDTYTQLLSLANTMKVIDTHEHLLPNKNFIGEKPDFLCDYFSHYITADLMSAGMVEEEINKVRNHQINLMERWNILEPYLELVRNTSYYKSLEIAAKTIHGIDDITRDTVQALNDSFVKKASHENYKNHIIREICNIECYINDHWDYDVKENTTEFSVSAWRPTEYIMGRSFRGEHLTLTEYCDGYKKRYRQLLSDGMKAIKLGIAYERSLYFEEVNFQEADELFNQYLHSGKKGGFPKRLQDYILHYVLQLANEDSFVIQIHTGLQEGMHNNLENSNPMLLKNLFKKYPNLTFDLFHIGYPYTREIITLAKYHENVFIDMCWVNIISPYAARMFFEEALDVVPYSKIFAFGGDYLFYDGVVGHITLAKQNICEVLAEKVDRGEYKPSLAEKILRAVFYDNAKRVFKIYEQL